MDNKLFLLFFFPILVKLRKLRANFLFPTWKVTIQNSLRSNTSREPVLNFLRISGAYRDLYLQPPPLASRALKTPSGRRSGHWTEGSTSCLNCYFLSSQRKTKKRQKCDRNLHSSNTVLSANGFFMRSWRMMRHPQRCHTALLRHRPVL